MALLLAHRRGQPGRTRRSSPPLLFGSLQPELAEAKGVPLRGCSVLFLAIVALATAECAQVVGVLLVFTLMVGPAAAAQRLTSRVGAGVLLAAALALVEAWGSITLAFYTDSPSSFWITTLSAAVYLLAVVSGPVYGPQAGRGAGNRALSTSSLIIGDIGHDRRAAGSGGAGVGGGVLGWCDASRC